MLNRLSSFACCFVCVCAGLGPVAVVAAETADTSLGVVHDFALQDFRGKKYSLQDFEDSKLVVCVFLGTECPLVKLYASRLAGLDEQYTSQGVAFVGINSNQQDSLTEIASYARRHGIRFPILKDLGNRFADQMKAQRTPEAFVWDQAGRVRYRGRVDDQFGVGYIRNEPTRRDLAAALDELLSGLPVSTPITEPAGCIIGRVREPDKDSPVTYSDQIVRILQKQCVECHRPGEIAPFTLLSYEDVVGWAEMIAEVVDQGRMPPWHADPIHGEFSNDRRLTAQEKEQIHEWVRRGAPEGDPAKLPAPPKFITGSQLPQPADMELFMRDEPFVVKAEGEVAYQNFVVDPQFTEGKWIKMAEALPGNRAVVHHIVVFVRPPNLKHRRGFAQGLEFLTTYVPGYLARPLPDGMAKWLPPGSRLIFQMHYTPIGQEQSDRSKLRLVFASPDEVKRMVVSSAVQIRHKDLLIPAHAADHRSEARGRVRFKDAELLSLFPHMHLRGKKFRIDAKYPSGEQETLLNVPQYDFNWQTTYRLLNPKPIPRGTELIIVGHHDNSLANLANPDPTKPVRWGDQTWEEMLIALYEWSVPLPDASDL